MPIRTFADAVKVLCVKDGVEIPSLVEALRKYEAQWTMYGVQLLISAGYTSEVFEVLCLVGPDRPESMFKVFLKGLKSSSAAFFSLCILDYQRAITVAKGLEPRDFLYDRAEKVTATSIPGYLNVTFRGCEYQMIRSTSGALDLDPEKSTVLIKTPSGIYYKLWFFDADVQSA